MELKLKRETKRSLLIVCLVGFAIYGMLNVLAMIFYPGGTTGDPGKTGYSFLENFFSDLGMVSTYAGQPNTLSRLLFSSALVLVGAVLILFFLLMSTFFTKPSSGRNLSRAGLIAGIMAGISCIGIAFTPWDRFLEVHMFFAFCLSLSFLGVASLYSAAIFRNPAYSNTYAMVYMVYFAFLLVFVVMMALGSDLERAAGFSVLATGQKVCIYLGMGCIALQVIGAYVFNRDAIGGKSDI
jgi:hypothetical protein